MEKETSKLHKGSLAFCITGEKGLGDDEGVHLADWCHRFDCFKCTCPYGGYCIKSCKVCETFLKK